MKKYINLTFIAFSQVLMADCLQNSSNFPCELEGYTYNYKAYGSGGGGTGDLTASAKNKNDLIQIAEERHIPDDYNSKLNAVKKINKIINNFNKDKDVNAVVNSIDTVGFSNNHEVVLNDLNLLHSADSLPGYKLYEIHAAKLTLNSAKGHDYGSHVYLSSSDVSSTHVLNNLTGKFNFLAFEAHKLGDLRIDINKANIDITDTFGIDAATLNINDSTIRFEGRNVSIKSENFSATDQADMAKAIANININYSKIFLPKQLHSHLGGLNLNLTKQSVMHTISVDQEVWDTQNPPTTSIELDNSAFVQYEIPGVSVLDISSVKLKNHSLLVGTYNINNLVANESVFGVGATKDTYLGAIKANSASGKNNAIWLMGAKLDADKNLAVIDTNDNLINLPLMVLKGDSTNYTDFISGITVGSNGWTDTYIKDFEKYVKMYQVDNNGNNPYTIYRLNINGNDEYAKGAVFSVGANGELLLNNNEYKNMFANDGKVIIGEETYGPYVMRDLTLVQKDPNDLYSPYVDTKLKYVGAPVVDEVPSPPPSPETPPTSPAPETPTPTPPTPPASELPEKPEMQPKPELPTVDKLRPAVIKAADEYSQFYNYAIKNIGLIDAHKLNQDGIWLDASTDYANGARKNTFKVGASKQNSAAWFDYYLGAFAEFSLSNLSSLGASVKKYGAGVYGGATWQNGAFASFDARLFNVKNHIDNEVLGKLSGNKAGFGLNYELGYLFDVNGFVIAPSLQQFITNSANFRLSNADGAIQARRKLLFSNKINTSLKYKLNEFVDLTLDLGYAFDLNSQPEFIISSHGLAKTLEKADKLNHFYAKLKTRANINEKFMIDFEYGKNFGKKYQSGYLLGATFKYIF